MPGSQETLRRRSSRASRVRRPRRLFISYRRDETWPHAKLLADGLRRRFDADRVFLDTDRIKQGESFDERIEDQLKQADVMLLLIGAKWLDWPDSGGGRRLDNPDDWVRKEIELAKRLQLRLIPILLNAAQMPGPTELPESLRWISYRQAVVLHDYQWDQDLSSLIARLKKPHPGNRFASREELRDLAERPALIRNAVFTPWAILPAILMGIIALLIGNPWLALVAGATYIALAIITYFSLVEAEFVGAGEGATSDAGIGDGTSERDRDPDTQP
jgi:TIR domain